MPFYKELPHFLITDKAISIQHIYDTMDKEEKKSLEEMLLQEKERENPEVRQPSDQENISDSIVMRCRNRGLEMLTYSFEQTTCTSPELEQSQYKKRDFMDRALDHFVATHNTIN